MRANPCMTEPALTATIDARVRAEQVRVIYQQAIPAQLISVVVACTTAYVVWDAI